MLSEATVRLAPSERDMRRKRSPALSFLLRIETVGRAARVLSLLALDFAGLALAIFTALVLKAAVLSDVNAHSAYEETRQHPRVCLPADGAAVRALGPVRGAGAAAGHDADRGVRCSR